MTATVAPPPPAGEGPKPASVIAALRAMSRLMAEGALGARLGEQEVAQMATSKPIQEGSTSGTEKDPDLQRQAVALGLLAGCMEATSGLASTLAYLIVEMDALRQQQAEILKRLGPKILIPGVDA